MKEYSEQELRSVLGKELEVSEIVNVRLQEVYEKIRKETEVQQRIKRRVHQRRYRRAITAAVAAVSTMTVCAAAYRSWENRLTEKLQINEGQQEILEDTGMAAFSNESCSDAGVTVTALQSITDHYYTHLNLKVEGYALPEGETPGFEKVSVTVDGNGEFSWGGSFYNGIVQKNDGTIGYADGQPLQYNDEGVIIEKYTAEDGSLEYHMTLANSEQEGFFIGKPIHIELENLGTAGLAETDVTQEGKWVLDWTLGGADTTQCYEMEEVLGDSGATVKEIELSPVSIRVLYDMTRIERTEEALMEDGSIGERTYYEGAPEPIGVKLKDGSLALYLYGGPGRDGFLDDSSNEYINTYAFDRVIDAEEAEAILFVKEYPEGMDPITEENCYVVPLKK